MRFNVRKLMTFISSVFMMFFLLCAVSAADYIVPHEFDLIDGTPNALHNIRIFSLTANGVNIVVTETGCADISAFLPDSGVFTDYQLPAGAVISTDQPVLVIKYAATTALNSTLIGNGTDLMIGTGEYFLIAASTDDTIVSVDSNNDGVTEAANLNAGYALLASVGQGKSANTSHPVTVFAISQGAMPLTNFYLLIPGEAYTPLYPAQAVTATGDFSL